MQINKTLYLCKAVPSFSSKTRTEPQSANSGSSKTKRILTSINTLKMAVQRAEIACCRANGISRKEDVIYILRKFLLVLHMGLIDTNTFSCI